MSQSFQVTARDPATKQSFTRRMPRADIAGKDSYPVPLLISAPSGILLVIYVDAQGRLRGQEQVTAPRHTLWPTRCDCTCPPPLPKLKQEIAAKW
jgi:hypothetical protein